MPDYPGGIDNFDTVNPTDKTTDGIGHAGHHNEAYSAIEAVENELGVNPSGAETTVADRLDVLEAEVDVADAKGDAAASHIADGSDAHDASAISVVPTGNIASNNVQAALVELDTEKSGTAHTHVGTGVHDILSDTHTDTYAADTPSDGQVMTWVNGNNRWEALDPASSGHEIQDSSNNPLAQQPTLKFDVGLQVVNQGAPNYKTVVAPNVGTGATQLAAGDHDHDADYVNEADHDKTAHDALNIDADTLDGLDSTDFVQQTEVGSINGVAELDAGGKVPLGQLPSIGTGTITYVVANQAALPTDPPTTLTEGETAFAIAEQTVWVWDGVAWQLFTDGSAGGAPTTSTYLVTTSDVTLTNEVVVGATPGGELGGTWASPTVDSTHAGSSHLTLGTSPSTQAFGDVAAGGAASDAAKTDHKHAMPAITDSTGTTSSTTAASATAVKSAYDTATGKPSLTANTPSTQAFGDSAVVGVGTAAAKDDHKHAMPTNPITAHEAASDPHTGYLKESDVAAKGDIYAATANDTVGIVTVGANDTILTADSTASSGVAWKIREKHVYTTAGTGLIGNTKTTVKDLTGITPQIGDIIKVNAVGVINNPAGAPDTPEFRWYMEWNPDNSDDNTEIFYHDISSNQNGSGQSWSMSCILVVTGSTTIRYMNSITNNLRTDSGLSIRSGNTTIASNFNGQQGAFEFRVKGTNDSGEKIEVYQAVIELIR